MRFVRGSVLVVLMLVGACDWNDGGDYSHTPAQDWRLAPLAEAKFPTAAPDSMNVVAFVLSKFICPEGDNCFGGSHMQLSERMYRGDIDGDNVLYLTSTTRGIRVGGRYLFSIRVSFDEGYGYRSRLAGYSHIPSGK